jgi:hypothetical protein
MRLRRILTGGVAITLFAITVGCSTSSSNSAGSDSAPDVILGSSELTPALSDSVAASSTSSGPPQTLPPVNDRVPQVPSDAVMAATVVVDSGRFKGTSKIQTTGSVGCSYSLFGDKQWRISFSSEGEFESKDTTTSGRRLISFVLTTQGDGTTDIAANYTSGNVGQDLEDKQGMATVSDDGSSVTFMYVGRNHDGTVFHGAALCTKALRSQ